MNAFVEPSRASPEKVALSNYSYVPPSRRRRRANRVGFWNVAFPTPGSDPSRLADPCRCPDQAGWQHVDGKQILVQIILVVAANGTWQRRKTPSRHAKPPKKKSS